MSHRVCKLTRLPSSCGTTPENWFPSRFLINNVYVRNINLPVLRTVNMPGKWRNVVTDVNTNLTF